MADLPAYLILASGGLGLALAIGGLVAIPFARRRKMQVLCRGLAIGGAIYTLLFLVFAAPAFFAPS